MNENQATMEEWGMRKGALQKITFLNCGVVKDDFERQQFCLMI